jgi:hypothetical protein
LKSIASLDVTDLEDFMQKLGNVVAMRKSPHLAGRESDLLQAINQPVPEKMQTVYARLSAKLRDETITPQEHEELLALIEAIEQFHAHRLQKLIELAQLRGTTLDALVQQLRIVLNKRA